MKKVLAVLILMVGISFAGQAHAQTAPTMIPPAAAYTAQSPDFLMFTGALGFGMLVMIMDVEGVPFPLCGVVGNKCYQEYPEAIHKDGV